MSPTTPLFLLNTVLMPGGVLALRVFEARYLDMLARCLREDTAFAVAAIESGSEVGEAATPMAVGTLARISDWDQGADGLLQVVVTGQRRVRLLSPRVCDDRLVVAEVEPLPDDEAVPLPEAFADLASGLQRLLEQLGAPYTGLQLQLDDTAWVANRLTELLPMVLAEKQALLELQQPLQRLEVIADWLRHQG